LYQERLQRLQTTAEHLDALKRDSGDGLQHPLWIGKPKQKKSLSEFLSGKPDDKTVPSAQDILDQLRKRRVVNGKFRYEDYINDYGKGNNTRLANDLLKNIDIVDLVTEAIFWGMDNHDAYGKNTKDVINCNTFSTLFRLLKELDLAE
jgi:hypothetical protein